MKLEDEQIYQAKQQAKYIDNDHHHEHDDCIRIAYAWLDAQQVTPKCMYQTFALKHIIESWAGRYVSQSDVEVAAELHPLIYGVYPHFNISPRLTLPDISRLDGIEEAGKHPNYLGRHGGVYTQVERVEQVKA